MDDDEWVFLDADNPADSGDELVVALSSSCSSTSSSSDTDSNSEDGEGAEDPYILEEEDNYSDGVEEEYSLQLALGKPLSGLFYHTRYSATAYAAFDPVRGVKELIPDPGFSFLPERVSIIASNRGLVCARGGTTRLYYITNPITFRWDRLPRSQRDHGEMGDAAVVVTFDGPGLYDSETFHVVVAFPVSEGVYAFESYSSKTGKWHIDGEICAAEVVVAVSGVGALGCAFWRTTIGYILCYDPELGSLNLIPAPSEVEHRPRWELSEMEGRLCVACVADCVDEVVVLYLDLDHRAEKISWLWAGQFDGGRLRNREYVTVLRSQGASEVVMWDPEDESVVAMDLEGRTTRTIVGQAGPGYCADFIPYVSTFIEISSEVVGAKCRKIAADAEISKLATSIESN